MKEPPPDEHGILRLFGRDLRAMEDPVRARLLEHAFEYWRKRGFPYPELTEAEIEQEFRLLERVDPDTILRDGEVRQTMTGLRLANSFHSQMWSVPVHGRSPVQCFEDDDCLRRALAKAVRFWPDRRCWNAQCTRSLMRIYRRARVSNFRPTVARAVISRYSRPGDVVLDFCAGYGGRLLGALTLERLYLGVDAAEEQVRGLRRMSNMLAPLAPGRAEIHHGCAEDLLRQFPSRSVDLVFTSPPYFNLEKYSAADTQSYRRYQTYEDWKERFLRVVIAESHRLLRPGGRLILNVADCRTHRLIDDTEMMAGELFSSKQILKMVMSAMPNLRARRGKLYRWEPLLVFEKRRAREEPCRVAEAICWERNTAGRTR